MKMNPVVHFEVPGEDLERMKKFYSSAFGWEMNQLGQDFGNYVVVMTSESDDKGPLEKGRINGGFYEKKSGMPIVSPSIVVSVDNINEAMEKVKQAGGKILGGSGNPDGYDDIPGVGLYCAFEDSEGNRLSMLQPVMNQ
jgi:uncharacterized protein